MSNSKPVIDFIFDFGSPNAYLAWKILPAIAARTGAEVNIIPCLLGGIFKATGNRSPFTAFKGVKGKLAYEMLELRRFIARHKLAAFKLNPHFPVNTLLVMRALVAAKRAGIEDAYVSVVSAAMWEQGEKMDDPEVFRRVLKAGGTRRRKAAGGDAGRPGQGRTRGQYRSRRGARGLWHSHLFRQGRDVLRQGAPGTGRGGGAGRQIGLAGGPGATVAQGRFRRIAVGP